MSEYNFNKNDIIQDNLDSIKKMESMLKGLEDTEKSLENMVENSKKAQENREKKEEFIKKSKKYATYTTRFIFLNAPTLLLICLIMYSIIQLGLCLTDYWFPKWYPDKYAIDWVKPFINSLPYAFHKNSNTLGHVVLNILVGVGAIVGIVHNFMARLDESYDKNWNSLGIYVVVTLIPSVLCGLFIYTIWTPTWYDKLTQFIQIITGIAILLGVISLFSAVGNLSGDSSSGCSCSSGSGGDSDYDSNNDYEERISRLENQEVPKTEEQRITGVRQNPNGSVSVYYKNFVNGKEQGTGGSWGTNGKLTSQSPYSVSIEYAHWVRTYDPKGKQISCYQVFD